MTRLVPVLFLLLLGGCQRFVDFDRDLLDGGDGGGSSARLAADPLDGGTPD